MTKKLAGKVALISGSGRGIGQAIALKLAAEGARVVVNDLDAGPANDIAARIRQAGGEAAVCTGDVAAADFGERFVKTALERFGGLDIIVNNAGFTWDSVIQKMSDEQWQTILDVHLTAPFRILRAASEPIRIAAKKEKEEGRAVHRKVVNVSSISGLFGNAGQVNYSAAKSALIGMTRTLAKEWGRYNVNVNAVAFGLIDTRLVQPLAAETAIEVRGQRIPVGVQPKVLEAVSTMIPLGRLGTVEEAAGAVLFFCSPLSDYVTGEVLVCSGGLRF